MGRALTMLKILSTFLFLLLPSIPLCLLLNCTNRSYVGSNGVAVCFQKRDWQSATETWIELRAMAKAHFLSFMELIIITQNTQHICVLTVNPIFLLSVACLLVSCTFATWASFPTLITNFFFPLSKTASSKTLCLTLDLWCSTQHVVGPCSFWVNIYIPLDYVTSRTQVGLMLCSHQMRSKFSPCVNAGVDNNNVCSHH